MIRWLRVTWPPAWALAGAALVYFAIEASVFVDLYHTHARPVATNSESPTVVGLSMFALIYGLFRVCAFHPFCLSGYHGWLRDTPWTQNKPLPLGPLHLVWQDALLIVIGVGACWPRAGCHALAIPATFLITYSAFLGLVNIVTGEFLWTYALISWFGVVVQLRQNQWSFFGSIAVAYGLAYFGARASLRRFPWPGTIAGQSLQELADLTKTRSLGWPFDQLGPRFRDAHAIGMRDSFLIGVLAGWWCYVISTLCRMDAEIGLVYLFAAMVTLGGAMVRLIAYMGGYVPPLSLFGRIMLLRWIIPGYDQIFVAPVLAMFVSFSAIALIGIAPVYGPPLAVALSWWILLGMGPRLQVWRLTGNHRITMYALAKANMTK